MQSDHGAKSKYAFQGLKGNTNYPVSL